MKTGIIVFPGSNCDTDCYRVFSNILNTDVRYVWHTKLHLDDLDLVILPGGFSYGDYLRPGAMACHSPIIEAIRTFAMTPNKYVLGICNGFQILTEMGLLPGALITNQAGRFICKQVELVTIQPNTPFTSGYVFNRPITMPIAHNEGNYYVDRRTYFNMASNGQIMFKYLDNPNGSKFDIAGVSNKEHNVVGMMPHPERAVELLLGSADGLPLFQSLLATVQL